MKEIEKRSRKLGEGILPMGNVHGYVKTGTDADIE
jgi:hypothetical protein